MDKNADWSLAANAEANAVAANGPNRPIPSLNQLWLSLFHIVVLCSKMRGLPLNCLFTTLNLKVHLKPSYVFGSRFNQQQFRFKITD